MNKEKSKQKASEDLRFSHIVLYKTNPKNLDSTKMIVKNADKYLKVAPGLVAYHCAPITDMGRAVTGDSYDVMLNMIFRNKQDYPISDNDPYNGEFERFLKAKIERKPIGTIYPISLENYDIIHFAESGGPGYGDPLERKIESVKQDLDDGFYTADIVKNVYGVVANFDDKNEEWIISNEATKERREEIRQERKDKSITFEEFWEKEKKKITEGKLYEAVSVMYSESLKLSTRWGKMFREFWKFPEDFQIEVKK